MGMYWFDCWFRAAGVVAEKSSCVIRLPPGCPKVFKDQQLHMREVNRLQSA